MKKRYSVLLALFSLCFSSALLAQPASFDDFDEQELEALRELINKPPPVTLKGIGGKLALSGEVRTEMQSTSERKAGVRQRGAGGAVSIAPTRAYDVEVNLMLNYRTERTWAVVKLEFDNNMGAISGSFNRINLERALFGVRLLNKPSYSFDAIFGRQAMSLPFDSRIQFASFLDGILFRLDKAFENFADFYVQAAPFIINETIDQYGYVGELGLLDIWNTGLYSKYSIIDWDTKNTTNEVRNNQFRFLNSQLLLGYRAKPSWFDNKSMTFYLAGLINHAAEPVPSIVPGNGLANKAWYGGFSIGEARREGDWSFDWNYQWVQGQAIPRFDVLGIGHGNAARVGFYSTTFLGATANTKEGAVGSTNYKGFAMQLLYLFTNNLTLYQSWRQSVNLNTNIGPFIRYKQYEMELIYAF